MLNDDSVVETRGENLMDLRQRINNELESNLLQQGHADIAHVLQQSKSIYKKLMNTYYNKNLPNAVGKLVQSDLRLVPEKPEDLFNQNSKPMQKFLKEHPEAARHAQGIKEKQAATKALGKIFGTTAAAGGVGYVGKSIYDLLK